MLRCVVPTSQLSTQSHTSAVAVQVTDACLFSHAASSVVGLHLLVQLLQVQVQKVYFLSTSWIDDYSLIILDSEPQLLKSVDKYKKYFKDFLVLLHLIIL